MVIHTITYWIAGLVFSILFDYQQLMSIPPLSVYMKPLDSIWVFAGPLLQPIRGVIMGVVLWPFRDVFVYRRRGWLYLWGLFVGLAIINAPGPSPGSIEGVIYSTLPVSRHLQGLPEVLAQTLAFSLLLVYWEQSRTSRRTWWVFVGLFGTLLAISALGIVVQF